MTRKPFPKELYSKSIDILDLIHSGVCVSTQTFTSVGKKYIFSLIDDYIVVYSCLPIE